MKLNIEDFFKSYNVKKITKNNLEEVYTLCLENNEYYKHMKMHPTLDNLEEVITELPPNTSIEDKYFIGIYENEELAAVLDLVCNYPNNETVFIGWLIINKKMQNKGLGSKILKYISDYIKKENYKYLYLGCIKTNEKAKSFWLKNGFLYDGIEYKHDDYEVVMMKKTL